MSTVTMSPCPHTVTSVCMSLASNVHVHSLYRRGCVCVCVCVCVSALKWYHNCGVPGGGCWCAPL